MDQKRDVLFVIGFASLVGILVLWLSYSSTTKRIDQVEEALTQVPPARYVLPDFAAMQAELPAEAVQHKSLYVPLYSHIYARQGSPILLESTLSIRNRDSRKPVYIRTLNYYGTSGNLVKRYLDAPIRLEPFQSVDLVIPAKDTQGGTGANFVVEWAAGEEIDPPQVEAVMVALVGTQAFSFVRPASEISPL